MLSLFVVFELCSLTRRRNWDIILEITENIKVLLFSERGGVSIERPHC